MPGARTVAISFPERDVVHLDIAAFAVAVERVREPRLRARPVVVAPPTPRGVVMAASFEARRAGIGRGMPVMRARRVCRDVIVVTPDEPLYARAARAVREILGRFTPVVEPAAGGRWFLDLTGTARLFGRPADTAARMAREVKERLRLPAAVGVAVNKTVSRVAADTIEPAGLLDIAHGDEASFLAPLPAARLPGVAGEVRSTLTDLNIRIVRELAEIDTGHLTMLFGRFGIVLHQRALGIDPTPVRVPDEEPAVVEETTLAEDTNDLAAIEAALFELSRRAGLGLRARGVTAGRLEVRIRYTDGEKAFARSELREPADLDPRLFEEGSRLLMRALQRRVRVRGLALRATGLARRPRQLSLFEEGAYRRDTGLVTALTALRAKFGETIVIHAGRAAASARAAGEGVGDDRAA
jgi:DNA polymerase-4